jgi:hypothetical protein
VRQRSCKKYEEKVETYSMTEHSEEIKQFIRDHSSLFWYIKPEAKERISLEFLVETILSFGNSRDVRWLESMSVQKDR